jgi:hypothetical protein
VGTYFLRNYYNLLQQNPDVVHQFYSDASTMVRVDDLAGTNTTVNNMMVSSTAVSSLAIRSRLRFLLSYYHCTPSILKLLSLLIF